jgi:hypothetical protein
MNVSSIQFSNLLKNSQTNTGEGKTGKVVSRQANTLEILIGDKIVKVEARSAGKLAPGDLVQVFFGDDGSFSTRIGSDTIDPLKAKLLDVFSLSLPFQIDTATQEVINEFSQSESYTFAKLTNELTRIVASLFEASTSENVKETAEKTKSSYFTYRPEDLKSSIIELALRVKNLGKAWEELPQHVKEEIVRSTLLEPLVKKHLFESLQTPTGGENIRNDSSGSQEYRVSITETTEPQFEPRLMKPAVNAEQNSPLLPADRAVALSINESFPLEKSTKPAQEMTRPESSNKETTIEQKQSAAFNRITPMNDGTTTFEKATTLEPQREPIVGFAIKEQDTKSSETLENTARSDEKSVSISSSSRKENIQTEQVNTLLGRIVREIKESFLEPQQMKYFYTSKEKRLDWVPLKLPINQAKDTESAVTLIKNDVNTDKPAASSDESFVIQKTDKKGYSEPRILNPLSEKIVRLLSSDTAKLTTEDRSLLETIAKLLRKPFVELTAQDKEPNERLSTNLSKSGKIWNAVQNNMESPEVLKKVGTETGIRWVKGLITIAHESASLPSFSRLVFEKSYSILFETQIKPETTQTLQQSGATTTQVETALEWLRNTMQTAGIELLGQGFEQESTRILSPKSDTLSLNVFDTAKSATDVDETLQSTRESGVIKQELPANVLERNPNNALQKDSALLDDDTESTSRAIKPGNSHQDTEKKTTPLIFDNRDMPINRTNVYDRILNIASNRQYDMIYAGFVDLGSSYFHVDLFHNKKASGGYDSAELYRIVIDAQTEQLGNVIIDTYCSDEKLDILLYADPQYGSYLAEHSRTLVQRLKEDGFSIRLFQIRSLQEKDKVINQKMKMLVGKERGFTKFA